MQLLSVTEFAALHRLTPDYVRQMILKGRLTGAQKIGKQWVLPADTPLSADRRIKSDQYIGFRKKK